jgi:hypothetical protein
MRACSSTRLRLSFSFFDRLHSQLPLAERKRFEACLRALVPALCPLAPGPFNAPFAAFLCFPRARREGLGLPDRGLAVTLIVVLPGMLFPSSPPAGAPVCVDVYLYRVLSAQAARPTTVRTLRSRNARMALTRRQTSSPRRSALSLRPA